MLNIVVTIILISGMGYFCYKEYEKCESKLEQGLYIVLFIIILIPIIIFYLDWYNIPTLMGWSKNIDSQNWLGFLANYSTGLISAFISAIVLVFVTSYQIRKNNEDSKTRDKENLRIQNMPILSYSMNTEYKENGELIKISNDKNDKLYYLNIYLKNRGLNNIKNIKIDMKLDGEDNKIYRIIGKDTTIVLGKEQDLEINKFFQAKTLEIPYRIEIIVYYEDVLTNWYKQVLELEYKTTNIFTDKRYCSTVKYSIHEEEKMKKENIEKEIYRN